MTAVPGRLKVILVFLILSVAVMFADGLMFDNYNSRPSMALMHMDMKPVLYAEPAAPSLEDYWEPFQQVPSKPFDADVPLEPEIIVEDGVEIKQYTLTMQNVLHEIRPGVKQPMFSFNRQIPGPTIRVTEGDKVRVIFINNGTDPHTIHWHGVNNLTFENDGVPDVTQDVVNPGEQFVYDLVAGPSGSKFYHCHVEAPHHITMGMFGAFIIEPHPENGGKYQGNPFDRHPDVDRLFLLNEFDSRHAHVAYPGEMMPMGPDGSLPWLIAPGRKFMMPFDADPNEFMINGKSFPYFDKPVRVKEGDIVRIKFINAGLMAKTIHIHGHDFTVTHQDGFPLPYPYKVDSLFMSASSRFDVWFEANNPGIWMMHEHSGAIHANGYDPAGIMTTIEYEGFDTEFYEAFRKRAYVYKENIEHMDEDHGSQTPSTAIGGDHMEMGEMGGGH